MQSDSTQNDELHANLSDDKKISVGFGVNYETSFRTGTYFRPTINVGAFIPLNDVEDGIEPILTLGGGLSLFFKNFKVGFSGGISGGMINAINSKYKDVDLNAYESYTEDLYVKKPKLGWNIGIGIGITLKKNTK